MVNHPSRGHSASYEIAVIEVQGDRYGASTEADRYRAEAAATAVLAALYIPASTAFDAYAGQWEEFDDEAPMTGAARAWIDARSAAEAALNEGWKNPVLSCSIVAK